MSSGRRFEYIFPVINRALKAGDLEPITGAALRVFCGSCGLGLSRANCPKNMVVHKPVGAGCVNGGKWCAA